MTPESAPLIWITRAAPGAADTAQRLQARGFQPLQAPLLQVHPLPVSIDMTGVTALAFTSANGVQAFAATRADRTLPVFAVGERTAQAARRCGFTDVTSAHADVAALAAMILTRKPKGRVLCPGPPRRAGDLVELLKAGGVQAQAADVYETIPVEVAPVEVLAALESRRLAAVLIHSERAGAAFAALAAPFDLRGVLAAGLSQACLNPLTSLLLAGRITAPWPQEAALLEVLTAALGKPTAAR